MQNPTARDIQIAASVAAIDADPVRLAALRAALLEAAIDEGIDGETVRRILSRGWIGYDQTSADCLVEEVLDRVDGEMDEGASVAEQIEYFLER